MIRQIAITLTNHERGFHLITSKIEKQIGRLPEAGILNLFLQHTSAALTINENADPSVRIDFETVFNKLIPEHDADYTHIFEGADDMPAHVKSSILGNSLSIPIQNNRLALGIWQGIYLCEFRNNGGRRNILATIYQ